MKKLLCLLCFALLLCSCEGTDIGKSESGYLDYLPKKTQVGANTFGCYINGELAASKGLYKEEGLEAPDWGVYTRKVNGFYGKYAFNGGNAVMQLHIGVKRAYFIIEYDSLYKGKYDCEVYIQFPSDSDFSGSVVTTTNITKFDQSNHIISGEIDALDIPLYEYEDSVVQLRKIRFDIKYGVNF